MSLNKIMLIGHLGKNPDIRNLENGSKVATFSLATTDKGYTLKNGTQVPDRTEWHNVVLWNGLAEVAEKYLHKGDKVYIEGKVRTRSYEDGQKITRYVTEVFGDNMELLTTKQQPQPQQYQQPVQQASPQRNYNQPQQVVEPWNEPHNQEPPKSPFPWDNAQYR